MRALVTGASGFIGANLARRLIAEGHQVHLLLRPGYRQWRVLGLDAQFHVTELEECLPVLERVKPDWVFHCAVHGAYPHQTDAGTIMRTNLMGTVALIEAAKQTGFEAFVQAGSSSEYGAKMGPPREDATLAPSTPYGVSKAAATLYAQMTRRVATLRLYSVYGPWEEPRRFIPTLLREAQKGCWPPLADPEIAHDFIFVDDVVGAFLAAAERKGTGTYNIGTGKQTTLAEAVNTVRDLIGVEAEPQWGTMPPRPWDTHVWVADPRRARFELGWCAQTGLRQGLEQTLEWMRAQTL